MSLKQPKEAPPACDLAAMPAEDFVARLLAEHLGAAGVVTGEDFTFGKGRGGNAALLRERGSVHGIGTSAVGPVMDGGLPVSSSRIRELLKKGEPRDTTIGAGPFTMENRERGVSISLKAFDGYYKEGLPKLAGVEAIVYADENLRVAALEAGDVDLSEYIPWQAMAQVEENADLKLDTVDGPFMYLTFNGERPPFDNPLVRRAVAHAIKREDIVEVTRKAASL